MGIKYEKDPQAYYEEIIGGLMEVMNEAYRNFFRLESLNEFLDVAKKADSLSFSNQLILWQKKINFTRFETYTKWQALGRQVRYGSKSTKFLTGNYRKPRVIYMFDRSVTSGRENKDEKHIAEHKNEILQYMKSYPLTGNTINENIYKGFDIARAYREGLGQDIEESMFDELETLVRNAALTDNELYHSYKSRQVQKEEILNAIKKISSILIASKLGEDVDSIYGKDGIKEIFRVLNNSTRLFAAWTHALELTDGFIREMEERFEKEAEPKTGRLQDKAIEKSKGSEKEITKEAEPSKKIGNNEDIVLLSIKDYDLEGLPVIYQNEEYKISGNIYSPNSFTGSMMRLSSVNEGSASLTKYYSDVHPVAELYARKIDLEKFRQSIAEEEKLQHEKQPLPEEEIQAEYTEKENLQEDDTEKETVEPTKFIIPGNTGEGQIVFNIENAIESIEPVTDVKPIVKADNISNYKITADTLPETLEPSKRLVNNVDAIIMLKSIEEGERELNTEAQVVLAKYVGWGGLADVFDETKLGQWEAVRNFLKENLTQHEYEAARQSTLTGFYTPKPVIDGMYKILSGMGLRKGNVLEPSMGIGNFIGNLPNEMQGVKFYGVEQDSISGRIAKLLYPESNIQIKGFEETTFSNNFFDASIGNVPFGDFKLNDRDYDRNNFLIHDYFFAKSIDKVRNGGIIAFITSSGTMDKKDESVRKYIAARAEFLGAIRLPNNTFKGMAGTEVTSDIIFFKKRDSVMERDEDWIHLSSDDKGLTYNKYFVDNPEMVIGTMEEVSGRFGNTITCSPVLSTVSGEMSGKSLGKRIEIIGEKISGKTRYEEAEILKEEKEAIPATDDVRNFSYTVIDGEVYYRENSLFMKNWMWKAVTETDEKGKEHTIHVRREPVKSEKEKVIAYIGVRNALDDVIKSQKENVSDEAVKAAQDRLNEVYDTFSKKYGFINGQGNTRLFRQDAAFPLVSSAEVLDEDRKFVSKGDIFTKRTIAVAKPIEHVDTSPEALVLSVSQKGKIDFSYMERLTGKDRKTLIEELKGEIFLNLTDMQKRYETVSLMPENGALPFINAAVTDIPKYEYVTKDEYLSGNIREKTGIVDSYISKLKYTESMSAERITEQEKEVLKNEVRLLEYQRAELMKAMPKELIASEINVKLGTAWIPAEDINDFVFKTLKPSAWVQPDIKVRFSEETGAWNIEGKSADKGNTLAEMAFGTGRVNAYKIIENALNLKDTKVYDRKKGHDGEEVSVLNKKETMLAGQKQELLNNEFKNWIFNDRDRRERLVKLYNERFNSVRNREYDGSSLTFEGMNASIELKPHQKNAVARILYGGNTLLAHVVGAGKTFEMVAAAMESKRLGLCTKSLIVVPNHITGQIGSEFMQLYPGANIMVADKKDFEMRNRKRFLGRIATGEYDAVIIGHTQFEKIPMSKEYQEKHIKSQIQGIIKSIEDYKYNINQKFSVKELEKTKKKLETRLEKLNSTFNKDYVAIFEELGVDRLFIDEAHEFKNLYLYTKMQNVAGIGTSEALKSSDMFMKCRYMDELTGGKGVVFATGTPVSNSMTELYTMQRYLQYDNLRKSGLLNFDSWASTFGETTTDFELSPEGTGYRVKTRFSKFFNLPELMTMFKETADIQTADMLSLPKPEAHYEVIKTKPTPEQKEILKALSDRADNVRGGDIDPKIDNMLRITNDGRKLALDQRLINPMLPDNPDSKVNMCVRKIFEIWENTREKKLAQLVFSDMSTPNGKSKFNIYDDIRKKLVTLGVPDKEIAFIHDAGNDIQKEKVFSKVRTGEVRILMGSTHKMGAGTNVQNKLIALHDLDVPWRPSDLEQRAGRIVRQGNENSDVYIYRYVTENTFDAYLWQTIENKQKFISQIMTSKTPVRAVEDVDESSLSYAEIKALATGNPMIKEKMDLDNEVTKLKMLEADYRANRYRLEEQLTKEYPGEIERTEKLITAVKEDIADIEYRKEDGDKFTFIILNGEKIEDKKTAGEKLLETIKNIPIYERKEIGNYRNFVLEAGYSFMRNEYTFTLKGKALHKGAFGNSSDGNITRLDNVIDKIPESLKKLSEKLETVKEQLVLAKAEFDKPFHKAEELKEKSTRLAELNSILEMGDEIKKSGYHISDRLAEKIVRFMENYDSSFEYSRDIKGHSNREEYIQTVKEDFLNGNDEKYSIKMDKLKNETSSALKEATNIETELHMYKEPGNIIEAASNSREACIDLER